MIKELTVFREITLFDERVIYIQNAEFWYVKVGGTCSDGCAGLTSHTRVRHALG
jgi:hypothetical protein